MDIFSIMFEKYKITKPIRLIELFTGYGSQAFALKYLGVEFEHWKTCEWAVNSIQAYKDAHFTIDNTDYSKYLTKQELIDYLFNKEISSNYNEPMELKQIQRINEDKLRTIYNNIQATNNLVNIQQVKGSDLEIKDTDKYDYIMTYSFPCQDLSLAGKRAGMSDTSTRSGMLWEVERILDELKVDNALPQVLLMENVPQVKQSANVDDFNKWQTKLESLGYKNYHQDLIATDYGIPQTRNRTFMISILGDYSYTFPNKIPLKIKLKDMLEENVEEKYYLSEKAIKGMLATDYQQNKYETRVQNEVCGTLCARDYKDPKCVEVFDFRYDEGIRSRVDVEMCPTIACKTGSAGISGQPLLKIKEATKKGYAIAHNGDGVYTNRPHQKRGVVQKGKIQTLKTAPDVGVISDDLRIRKLTPKECFRLMGVKDEDYDNIAKNQSDSSLFHLAGDSIVVNVLMAIFRELVGE